MINLGKYEYAGKVKIITVDGHTYIGKAGEATMKEDEEEMEIENPSDWLSVWVDGLLISFRPEDIRSIEIVD